MDFKNGDYETAKDFKYSFKQISAINFQLSWKSFFDINELFKHPEDIKNKTGQFATRDLVKSILSNKDIYLYID